MSDRDDVIKMIDFSIKATGANDSYSAGLCNGLMLAKSFITGEEPNFFKARKEECIYEQQSE